MSTPWWRPEMTKYHSVTVSHGSGGYGGPLTITPVSYTHLTLPTIYSV